MNKNDILKERPSVDDFDLQPYGYIKALTDYINKLEQAIEVMRCCVKEDSEETQTFVEDVIDREEAFNEEVSSLFCEDCQKWVEKQCPCGNMELCRDETS